MNWYITLLACGLFLIGLEIFVPGGILGIFGAAALIGAAVIGFTDPDFPSWFGWVSAFGILCLSGAAVFIWIRFLPTSPIGRVLSLTQEIEKKDRDDSPWKPGMVGTAASGLRPAGKALIEGRRADVIAENGTFIAHNAAIEIARISGNRIYVKEV